MNKFDLIKRNLLFYKKAHLRTITGFALSSAILVGGLIIGDSVRLSLRQMVTDRLGDTAFALESDERYFTIPLAERLSTAVNAWVAPVLRSKGIVIVDGGQRKVGQVQILGVDQRFGALSNALEFYSDLSDNEIIINSKLANHLLLNVGDEILLRLQKPEYIPLDIPLIPDDDLSFSKRYTIRAIADIEHFGNFNLRISQVVPNTVFLSLEHLNREMELDDRANVLLVSPAENVAPTSQQLQDALSDQWTIEDAGLKLIRIPGLKEIELRSERIFIDPAINDAVLQSGLKAKPIFTYFVNSLQSKSALTPYSFVSAPGFPSIPNKMKDDEIIINSWLANDLKVKAGDPISLQYYVLGKNRTLLEESLEFNIHAIVPIDGIYADKYLMPDFPGLADQENCRDWDPGIPINLDLIRPTDEKYWDDYGGTPKAFIKLDAAQRMWENRFGSTTAFRFSGSDLELINLKLAEKLSPASSGYVFQPVREQGLKAGTDSVDFSQLFLGLSFFIIIGAMLLTGLLFLFNLERRTEEQGLYRTFGYSNMEILRLFFYEGSFLAIIGGAIGILLALLYNSLIIIALKTVWFDIVGTTNISMYIQFSTLIIGTFIAIAFALITIWIIVKRKSRSNIIDLIQGSNSLQKSPKRIYYFSSLIIAILCSIAAIFIISTTNPGKDKDAAISFFVVGFFLLTAGIAFSHFYLTRLRLKRSIFKLRLKNLGFSNIARNRTRSLTLVGLLSSGLFIIFTVGSNQQGLQQDIGLRSSGTGGFTLFAESMIPVLQDLNNKNGQEFYGLDQHKIKDISVVPLRVREGDDASCLNLNRISRPRLVGVDPVELSTRGSFSFVSLAEGIDKIDTWSALNQNKSTEVIPGIADETVIIWGLGKTVGDTLLYFDEFGKPFKIKLIAGLANSVFQGNLIISEAHFSEKYPSVSGYRMFLVDTRPEQLQIVEEELVWALQNLGFEAVSSADRLAEFNSVQNTYLSIFLILGGLGLILGTIGTGIIVLRNITDRRGELALLECVGFKRQQLFILIVSEHGFLVSAGILLGLISSLLASLPALLTPQSPVPYTTILLTLLVVSVNIGFWIIIATKSALSENLISALRQE